MLLKDNGELWAKCGNKYGELGLGHNRPIKEPIKIADDVEHFANEYSYTIILKRDSTVWGCGCGNSVDDVSFYTFRLIMCDVVQFVSNYNSVCVLKTNGEVWGCSKELISPTNYSGELKRIASNVIQIDGFAFNILSLNKEGDVWKFRNSSVERIGTNIVQICCGLEHILMLDNTGDVYGYGDNAFGELGENYNSDAYRVELIAKDVKQISCAEFNTFMLKTNGEVWGGGDYEFCRTGSYSSCDCSNLCPHEYDNGGYCIRDNCEHHNSECGNYSKVFVRIADDAEQIFCGIDYVLIMRTCGDIYVIGKYLGFTYTNLVKIDFAGEFPEKYVLKANYPKSARIAANC